MAIVDVIEHQCKIQRDGLYAWFRVHEWFVLSDNDYEDPLRVVAAPFNDEADWNADPIKDPERGQIALTWGYKMIRDGAGVVGKPNPPHVPWQDQDVFVQECSAELFDVLESRRKWLVTGIFVDFYSANRHGGQRADVKKYNSGGDPDNVPPAIDTARGDTYSWERQKTLTDPNQGNVATARNSAQQVLPPQTVPHSTATMARRYVLTDASFSESQREDALGAVNSQPYGGYAARTLRLARWDYEPRYVVTGAAMARSAKRYVVCELEWEFDSLTHDVRTPDAGTAEHDGAVGPAVEKIKTITGTDARGNPTYGPEYLLNGSGGYQEDPQAAAIELRHNYQKQYDFNSLPQPIAAPD